MLEVNAQQIKVPEGMYIVSEMDTNGVITDANNDFLSITGYSKEEIVGKDFKTVKHPDLPTEAIDNLWWTIQAGRTWTGYIKNTAKDGKYFWSYVCVTPVSRPDGYKGYVFVRQRMTDKEIEREEQRIVKYQQFVASRGSEWKKNP